MDRTTRQQLTPEHPRSSDDPALVEQVFDTATADEMRELTGVKAPEKPEDEDPGNLEVSEGELVATGEAKESLAEKRREEFIQWAAEIDHGADWVDKMFEFEYGGRVKLVEPLILNGLGFKEFPKDLYSENVGISLASNGLDVISIMPDGVVELDFQFNEIKKIENLPKTLRRLFLFENEVECLENIPEGVIRIEAGSNKISEIKDLPNTMNYLDLSHNPISDLRGLAGKSIDVLCLAGVTATTIPKGIDIDTIIIGSGQDELEADAVSKGYHVEVDTGL